MDCFCRALNLRRQVCRAAVVVDPLDCLVTRGAGGMGYVEDPEEDLTCSRPVELEVLDQAWDGPVDQVAAVSGC